MLLPTDKTLRMTDAVVWLRPGEGALGLAGAAGVHAANKTVADELLPASPSCASTQCSAHR